MNAIVGKNCHIEPNVILCYDNLSKLREGYKIQPTVIGDNVTIRSGSIIYAGCLIEDNAHIGHNTVLREFTHVGSHSSIGSNVVCEGYTIIGHHTTIHAQTHLTALMSIGNYVFIGPNVTTMNDKRIRYCRCRIKNSQDCGAVIGDGVAIGGGACILPQVIIQMGCIIGSGAVVTKDCQKFRVYIGSPAKAVRLIKDDEVVDYLNPIYLGFKEEMNLG
jgi:acetyltransferase-like isoleucine patch superfamily enzyme